MRRGVLAGAAAAAAWGAAEPLAQRVFRTPYSDVRLLGATVTRGPAWPLVGLAIHVVNGAVFGAMFERFGGRGWKHGLLAAEAENLVLWPALAVVDRFHPDRQSGAWPPLRRSWRVLAYEISVHALFGVVLGALLPKDS